jgi:hypothetical protein
VVRNLPASEQFLGSASELPALLAAGLIRVLSHQFQDGRTSLVVLSDVSCLERVGDVGLTVPTGLPSPRAEDQENMKCR